MKCLLKTIIAIVVIVVVGGLLLWFVGIPAMLEQDKAVKNLEKKDYTVVSVDEDSLLGVADMFMPDDVKGYVCGYSDEDDSDEDDSDGYDIDAVTLYYFDDTGAAKAAKEDIEKSFNEYIDSAMEALDGLSSVLGSVFSDAKESLEELRDDFKIVRFGKIVVTGSVRGIITAMTGF